MEPDLDAVHARYPPVDARVTEILEHIRRDCRELTLERRNEGNERQVEEFIARLRVEFGEHVVIERQRLSAWAVRTTRWNYLFTVPGESDDRIVLVAHYDTWRGPGADDNTTGEEILKQYLIADLRAARRPALTHTYFLAGSEECGLIGLTSQLLLALGLQAANLALTQQNWLYAGVALALAPLAGYRFGVSGSREYVKTLSTEELRRIRGVVSVDSVGEGRLYIPRGTLGADFLHVLIPFGDYDSINDLLEEGAHLHGIKYNNYLAGGTTDHVSFLEVNNGLWSRARDAVRRAAARLTGRRYTPPLRIPATALVAMVPGKASPIVFGGKIHTPRDTPDRVYPEPLRETLLILDYFFHRLEGRARGRAALPRRVPLRAAVPCGRRPPPRAEGCRRAQPPQCERRVPGEGDDRRRARRGPRSRDGRVGRGDAAARPGRRHVRPAGPLLGTGAHRPARGHRGRHAAALRPQARAMAAARTTLPPRCRRVPGGRAPLHLRHVLCAGVRAGAGVRLGVRRGVRPVPALRDLGREPHHRHAGRSGGDRARDPALPDGAAHTYVDRQWVQAREQGRQFGEFKTRAGIDDEGDAKVPRR